MCSGTYSAYICNRLININTAKPAITKKVQFSPRVEPGTFRVLGERDNHYTTETADIRMQNSGLGEIRWLVHVHVCIHTYMSV